MSTLNNTIPFDTELDKITEREVVYDFVSRLSTGTKMVNPDDNGIIFPAGTKLKDGIIVNMIRTMDTSDIMHLKNIATSYTAVSEGDTEITINSPMSEEDGTYLLYRIIQESTGQDVRECFEPSHDSSFHYTAKLDVPITKRDKYKAYFYFSKII